MKDKKSVKNKCLILHNVRSVYNAGAIFRTADAVGIDKIYISGYTPAPVDRFGRVRSDFHKSALGAEMNVAWEEVSSVGKLLKQLAREDFQIIALEQAKNSIDYKKVKVKNKVAVIVGNEVRGLSKPLQKKCHVIAEIPMRGKKESLNVSVAAGILLYRLLD